MNCGNRRVSFLAAVFGGLLANTLYAQVNVTTYHNDNARTGQNVQEAVLTPANVNTTQFGKLFTVAVDGWVYAQPLYLSNVSIGGGTHNVVYVATEHDSLYAIDADSGTIYWQVSLIPAGGATPNSVNDLNCKDMVPEHGVTGTPVIDTSTGTIYMTAISKVNGNFVQQLHAIDVSTSLEKFGAPINITATVQGTATDGTGTTVSFNPKMENQRPGLLLENGHVVIGWGSTCDNSPWHGWVISYNSTTLAQDGVFNTSPNGFFDGVWMGGGGLAADSSGNIYFATGNGSWNGTSDYGDSIVKLGPASNGTFPVTDYFTPYNQNTLAEQDQDVASGGLVLLPALPSGQQLLAQMSKQGTIYLLDRSNMGQYCINATPACTSSDPQIVQETLKATVGIWGSPAYWNGSVYWGAGNDDNGATDSIKAFSLNANNSGVLSTTPTSKTTNAFAYSAPTPTISANGTANGILWGLDDSAFRSTCTTGATCQVLYAYDATDLSKLLYTSNQAVSNRDVPGGAVKFATPIVANGKVYVGSQYAVSAFGLLSGPVAASPTVSPAGGSFTSAQTVMLSDTTPGAKIYYTTDGTTPSTNSTQYTTALQISATTTIEAFAVAPGFSNSPVSSAVFNIFAPGTTPVTASLTAASNVRALGNPGSAVTGGGIDGGGFVYSAASLGSSVTWNGSTFTFGAAGALDAVKNTVVTLPSGNFSTLNLLATGVNGSQANQTFTITYTDGTTTVIKQSLSDWFYPQSYTGESIAATTAYRLTSAGAAGTGPCYVYGYSFALNSAKTVKSITLPVNANVIVLAIDLTPSGAAPPPTVATPTFSPPAGSFTTAQSVMLSDTTTGAVIYYTTDGSTPTTNSAKYATALPISVTTTVNAIAVASGYANSVVASALYTISSGSSGTTPVSVSLAAAGNVHALANDGSAVTGGGIDGGGHALSEILTGTSVTWSGSTFTFGAPGALDGVRNAVVTLPAGSFSTLNLLATGVNGGQANQTFTVTYTDGTTTVVKQSVSDWFYPQNYAGESTVVTTAYRLTSAGAPDTGPCYIYGYSFALNSAKTVKSITLPGNANVIVLAIDLTPSGVAPPPTVATPTFSPPAGSFTTAQSVMLSDTTTGAVIYYTTDGSTPTTNSAKYATALPISVTTTVNAIAVASGYTNSVIASALYTISSGSSGTTPVSVSLAAAGNVHALANDGSTVTGGGIDSGGHAYSEILTGTSVTWSGSTFTFGAPGALDGVRNAVVTLPAGSFSTLNLLATGVNGSQANQTFTVTYTDGTTTVVKQSVSDWFYPQNYAGESIVVTTAYRLTSAGAPDTGPCYIYGYSFALNSAKTIKSITLPGSTNVVLLAMTLNP